MTESIHPQEQDLFSLFCDFSYNAYLGVLKIENIDTIEDEFHFILECSRYADILKKYINKCYWSRPNVLKFNQLICSGLETARVLLVLECLWRRSG